MRGLVSSGTVVVLGSDVVGRIVVATGRSVVTVTSGSSSMTTTYDSFGTSVDDVDEVPFPADSEFLMNG